MEEYNLFLKLNTLNNLINDDILLIDKCSAELSLKQETENKLTVQKRLLSLLEENNVITKRTEEKISQLEKDRLNQERELKEKDEIILKANNKVKEVMSDNKNLEISLNNVKSEKSRLEKLVKNKNEDQDLEDKLRNRLRSLFDSK